jgi:hypothetical protein
VKRRVSSLSALVLGLAAAGCSGGSIGGVIPQTDEVTLLEVQAQVFSPRCALSGCHVGTDAPFGLDLSSGLSRGNLVDVPSGEVPQLLRVQPFNASDSYLFKKLMGDPDINGDPMPLTGGPLGAADLALIQSWIEQGAM